MPPAYSFVDLTIPGYPICGKSPPCRSAPAGSGRIVASGSCPEVAPAWSPSAYQHWPDWAANVIGSDKPAYRKLATNGADPTPADHAIHPRSPVGGRGIGGEYLGRLAMARSRLRACDI